MLKDVSILKNAETQFNTVPASGATCLALASAIYAYDCIHVMECNKAAPAEPFPLFIKFPSLTLLQHIVCMRINLRTPLCIACPMPFADASHPKRAGRIKGTA